MLKCLSPACSRSVPGECRVAARIHTRLRQGDLQHHTQPEICRQPACLGTVLYITTWQTTTYGIQPTYRVKRSMCRVKRRLRCVHSGERHTPCSTAVAGNVLSVALCTLTCNTHMYARTTHIYAHAAPTHKLSLFCANSHARRRQNVQRGMQYPLQ
jgi:hypothetical protein